jgi:hypothetical protein
LTYRPWSQISNLVLGPFSYTKILWRRCTFGHPKTNCEKEWRWILGGWKVPSKYNRKFLLVFYVSKLKPLIPSLRTRVFMNKGPLISFKP